MPVAYPGASLIGARGRSGILSLYGRSGRPSGSFGCRIYWLGCRPSRLLDLVNRVEHQHVFHVSVLVQNRNSEVAQLDALRRRTAIAGRPVGTNDQLLGLQL